MAVKSIQARSGTAQMRANISSVDVRYDKDDDVLKFLDDDGSTVRQVATTAQTQTLTNKTLTSPTLNTPTLNQPVVAAITAAVTAAGTQQGDGAIATSGLGVVRVTAADTTKVVTLPAATAGKILIVQNVVTNKDLPVYPASGEIINALSSNAAYTLAGAKTAVFACGVAGTWFTILTA